MESMSLNLTVISVMIFLCIFTLKPAYKQLVRTVYVSLNVISIRQLCGRTYAGGKGRSCIITKIRDQTALKRLDSKRTGPSAVPYIPGRKLFITSALNA